MRTNVSTANDPQRQISLLTDPLFFHQSPSSTRDTENKNRGGFNDRQRKGVGWGKTFLSRAQRSFSSALFARALADVFQKNEKEVKQRLCTG